MKCGFLGDRLQLFIARDPAAVLPACEVPEPVAHLAKARGQIHAVPAQKVTDGADARLFQRGLHCRAHAPENAHRSGAQKGFGLGRADDGKAARFVEIGGDFGQKLVVREADRAGDAQFLLHPLGEAGEQDGRRRAVQAGGAGEIQKRLIQREGFDGGSQILHHRADGAADLDIAGHAGFDDHRFGAEFERLKHRHRRAHAMDAGDVAAGGDDATGAAADDQWLVGKAGIVALFDRGVEGIAIHMGDGEAEQIGVRQQARAATGRTAAP